MCTWRNQVNGNNKTIQDDFDWTLGSGSTYSYYTGPSSDHTTGSALGKSEFAIRVKAIFGIDT